MSTRSERVPLSSSERRDVVSHSCRRLGVDDRNHRRGRVRREQPVGVDRLAPLGVDADDLSTVTARHFAHPLAEDAVDADDDRVAGTDEVDEGRLHACGAGSAHGKGQGVRSPEDLAQAVIRVVEKRQELRIEVSEHRSGQCHRDFRVRVRRPGSHE